MAHLAIAAIVAQNTYTDWIEARGSKLVDVSISGGTTSTVTIQRSYDGSTALDVEEHTTDAERVLQSGAFKYFRVGVKTGDYVDGATLRIEAGNAY
jgi:hypothetical protein